MGSLFEMTENMTMDFFIAAHAEKIRHRKFERHGEIASMSRNIDSGDSTHPASDGNPSVGTRGAVVDVARATPYQFQGRILPVAVNGASIFNRQDHR